MTTESDLSPAIADELQDAIDEWHADPARLTFLEYRDRCMYGRPSPDGHYRNCDRRLLLQSFSYQVRENDNPYTNGEDVEYGTWSKALEAGRSYLVGDKVPMAKFVSAHTSSLTDWQKQAFLWCMSNPSRSLELEALTGRPLQYKIRKRGEYVEIGLPYHDYGGERYWITRDGKRKVLINVD